MSETIHLRFAIKTWAITFVSSQTAGLNHSPFTLAKQIGQDCRLLFADSALVRQVACSKYAQIGVFRLYARFDFPGEPALVRKILNKICVANNALHYNVYDPLNYQEPVNLPFELDESTLDVALTRIRENQAKIISDVAIGMDIYVEEL